MKPGVDFGFVFFFLTTQKEYFFGEITFLSHCDPNGPVSEDTLNSNRAPKGHTDISVRSFSSSTRCGDEVGT